MQHETVYPGQVSPTRLPVRASDTPVLDGPCTDLSKKSGTRTSTQTTQSLPQRRASMHTIQYSARHAQQAHLIAAWKSHKDPKALQHLLADYQFLFQKHIKAVLRGRTLSAHHEQDLIQECAFAFIRGLENYDPEKSPAFSAFITRYIKGALQRYILDFRAAYKLGSGPRDRKVYYMAQKMRAARMAQGASGLGEADVEALAQSTETDAETARRAILALQGEHIDLSALDFEDERDDTSGQAIERATFAAGIQAFERAMLLLPEREQRVLRETLLGHAQDNVFERLAEELSISSRRVRQIQESALKDVRVLMEDQQVTAASLF